MATSVMDVDSWIFVYGNIESDDQWQIQDQKYACAVEQHAEDELVVTHGTQRR